MTRFALHPAIDRAALRAAFTRDGRVRIEPFLVVETAAALHAHIAARDDWRQVVNSGDKVFELDRPTRAAMTAVQHKALDEAVADGARSGFQYRFESLRVPDGSIARTQRADPLKAFAAWLSADPARDLMVSITGADDIVFADAQATAYAPGDLLTAHDDVVAGKNRRAAYVLGLNPKWRPEWGGLLLFHSAAGRVEGVAPAFNTLDLFAVPSVHSVSEVSRAAPCRRYSVTGWLRAGPQPD